MYLERESATAFIRRVLAVAVDEKPGRFAFVLEPGRISLNLYESVPGHGVARVVDRISLELSDPDRARCVLSAARGEA
jgi:hypothetical protein